MLGVFLTSLATLFEEISSSIGKWKVAMQEESVFTMGFLSVLGASLFFLVIAIVKENSFVFSVQSLPTFLVRAVLEILQLHTSMMAVVRSDRSTYGFIRTGTIVLVLIIDITLGYKLHLTQLIGIGVIIFSLLFIFTSHSINKRGIGYTIFCTVNAAITTSLYKYNISHFNSVVAEQLITCGMLSIVFSIGAYIFAKENPFVFLKKRIYMAQTSTQGIDAVIESFAYGLAPASVIIAAKRSSAVFWSVLSGKAYFKEKNTLVKILLFAVLAGGIILLVF